jgi:hypothetical protein
MTALAMILGMLPMALGLSEGGEQNAALGRAVIGGLLVADGRHALLRPRRLLARQPLPQAGGSGACRPQRLKQRRNAMNAMKISLTAGAIVVAGLLAAGIVPRVERDARAAESQRRAGLAPKVLVDLPKMSARSFEVALPGSTRALQETTLLRPHERLRQQDPGGHGRQRPRRQLLAVIESPEVDEELARARVRVQESKSKPRPRAEHARPDPGASQGRAVSEQENDDQQARVNSAEAALRGGEADVRRLESLQSFQKVVAPRSRE